MTQAILNHINKLTTLSPNQRLKYIRKKILGLNQDQFCQDGIIKISTLKAIESDAYKITPNMASKLLYKLLISGVICNEDIFEVGAQQVSIEIDNSVQENNFSLTQEISLFDSKLKKLKAIKIKSDLYEPFIKLGSLIFIDINNQISYKDLNQTLCLVEGSTTKILFLTHKDNQIYAEFKDDKIIFSIDALKMCKVYIINVIYYD